MELKISVQLAGEYKGSKVVQTPCFVGRSKEAGLTISHPSVSRKHCELSEKEGQLYLRDNSSLNGTLFKGEFVEDSVPVKPGDEFVIGELTLRIESTSDEKAQPVENAAKETENWSPASQAIPPEMVTIVDPSQKAEIDDDGELRLAPE